MKTLRTEMWRWTAHRSAENYAEQHTLVTEIVGGANPPQIVTHLPNACSEAEDAPPKPARLAAVQDAHRRAVSYMHKQGWLTPTEAMRMVAVARYRELLKEYDPAHKALAMPV